MPPSPANPKKCPGSGPHSCSPGKVQTRPGCGCIAVEGSGSPCIRALRHLGPGSRWRPSPAATPHRARRPRWASSSGSPSAGRRPAPDCGSPWNRDPGNGDVACSTRSSPRCRTGAERGPRRPLSEIRRSGGTRRAGGASGRAPISRSPSGQPGGRPRCGRASLRLARRRRPTVCCRAPGGGGTSHRRLDRSSQALRPPDARSPAEAHPRCRRRGRSRGRRRPAGRPGHRGPGGRTPGPGSGDGRHCSGSRRHRRR